MLRGRTGGRKLKLQSLLNSALGGSKWSASRSADLSPAKGLPPPDTHWIGGWEGLRASLGVLEKRYLSYPYRDSNPKPSNSLSSHYMLFRLSRLTCGVCKASLNKLRLNQVGHVYCSMFITSCTKSCSFTFGPGRNTEQACTGPRCRICQCRVRWVWMLILHSYCRQDRRRPLCRCSSLAD